MKLKLLMKAVCACIIGTSTVWAQKADSLNTIHLDLVTVSSFRVKSDLKEIPQNIQVLQKNDIREIPNESLNELLKKTAGVDVIEYPGFLANIGMRGFAPSALNGSYTLLLVNGLPAGTGNPSTLDLNNAEQVEVLKGPYSSFFGSGAMAGVINIVTPVSNDTIRGNVSLSIGSFDTYSFKAQTGGAVTNKLNFDFSAKMLTQNDNYKTGSHNIPDLSEYEKQIMGNTYEKRFQNTRFTKYDAHLRLGYTFMKDWKINLFENVFVADPIYDNGNFWGTYGSTQKIIQRWSQIISINGQVGIHSIKFSPHFSNENTNYYNNISDSNYITNTDNYKSYGFVLQDGIKLGNHYAIIGIDNHSKRYSNEAWANTDQRTTPYQPDYLNSANGAFLQLRFSFFENKLTSAVGARFDLTYFKVYKTDFLPSDNSNETYKTFNPNINIKYNFLPGLNVHAGAGTAFLAPTAFEKAGIYSTAYGVYAGNPNLQAEKSKSFDVGISYDNFKSGISADITFFDNKQSGMIGYDYSKQDTTSFRNAESAITNGIECSMAYDFGSLSGYRYSLKLYVNLMHLFKSDVIIDAITSPMKYVRKDNASFGVEYRNFKSFSFRLNGRFIGHKYEDNWLIGYDNNYNPVPINAADGNPIRPSLINDAVLKLPDFLVFDLSGSYSFSKKYSVGLSLQNLFNENYTEKDAYYMPGRTITAGFTYLF
jgi:vitamin B12 transporter